MWEEGRQTHKSPPYPVLPRPCPATGLSARVDFPSFSASLPAIHHVSYSKMRSRKGGQGGKNRGDRARESPSHDDTIHTDGKTEKQ